MKISISSYSFFQYIGSGKLDLLSIIAKAAEMGFDAIEYIDLPGATQEERLALAAQIRAESDKCGLPVSSYVVGGNLYQPTEEAMQAEVQRLKDQLDIAKVLGASVFRFDCFPQLPRYTTFGAVMAAIVPGIRQIADYGKALGIVTTSENHGQVYQDYDRIERTVEAVNHDNYGVLVDIGNFLCADQNNVQCVSRLAHLARHVHMKDFEIIDYYSDASREDAFSTRACNWLRGTAVGYGGAKAAQCLQILKSSGYDDYIVIEFEGPKDCLEEIAKGLAFCKAHI